MIYINFGGIRDPFKQNLALQFFRNRSKDVSILTKTDINLDQVRNNHIRNNSLGAIFLSPGNSHTKGLIVLLHLGLEGVTEIDTDPKERCVSFTLPSLMTKFSVFMPLQGVEPGNSWLGCVSLKDYKIIWKMKTRELKKN